MEKKQLEGSKGQANYVAKCKVCNRVGNIEFLDGSLKPYEDQNENFQRIATFDCRGIELCQFFPGHSFSAASLLSEQIFGSSEGGEPLDLKDGDWEGYDEEEQESVAVYSFTSQFVRNQTK